MDFDKIRKLSDPDMAQVNALIATQLESDVALIKQLGFYIVNSGGKRLRPMIAVLAARAVGYQGTAHHQLAAIVEFIHTSTLLHDDVVDESTLRRGKQTANALFGNQASVLVGDFLYTRSFQMMVSIDSMQVMKGFADATNVIAEGEVMQLMNCNDPDTSENAYMNVIYCKTARLFEAATELAAVISGQSEDVISAMRNYGRYLGTAFQLTDDLLDYTSNADELGKNIGDDLAEGKPTLPLLHAMHHGTPEQSEMIRIAIEKGGELDKLDPILDAMHSSGAFDYTANKAHQEAEKAVKALVPVAESEFKQALIALARIAASRRK